MHISTMTNLYSFMGFFMQVPESNISIKWHYLHRITAECVAIGLLTLHQIFTYKITGPKSHKFDRMELECQVCMQGRSH